VEGAFLRDAREERHGLLELRREEAHHVVARYPVDVGEVVRCGLLGSWASHSCVPFVVRSARRRPSARGEWSLRQGAEPWQEPGECALSRWQRICINIARGCCGLQTGGRCMAAPFRHSNRGPYASHAKQRKICCLEIPSVTPQETVFGLYQGAH